jgi:hypothetical protein
LIPHVHAAVQQHVLLIDRCDIELLHAAPCTTMWLWLCECRLRVLPAPYNLHLITTN